MPLNFDGQPFKFLRKNDNFECCVAMMAILVVLVAYHMIFLELAKMAAPSKIFLLFIFLLYATFTAIYTTRCHGNKCCGATTSNPVIKTNISYELFHIHKKCIIAHC